MIYDHNYPQYGAYVDNIVASKPYVMPLKSTSKVNYMLYPVNNTEVNTHTSIPTTTQLFPRPHGLIL